VGDAIPTEERTKERTKGADQLERYPKKDYPNQLERTTSLDLLNEGAYQLERTTSLDLLNEGTPTYRSGYLSNLIKKFKECI